jgi:glycerophosphoryl diester phosphodiesterase
MTLIIAHRGGAGLWPENTLAAFENALARFAAAELDVQLTRDGRLVVFHDFRLKPEICRDAKGQWLAAPGPFIKDMTFAELRTFDIGRPKPNTEYARAHPMLTPQDGERIPLLSEVLEVVKGSKNFRLFVEIKTNFKDRSQSAPPEAVAEATLVVLRENKFLERAALCGFDWAALTHALKLEPAMECWFTTPREGTKDIPALLRSIKQMKGGGWSPHFSDATPAAISQAHDLGLKVAAYTVNDVSEMRVLADAGLDAVFTDRPDLMAAI